MKRTAIILLVLLVSLAFPFPVQCATCCQGVTWIRGGDCDNYWHKFSVPSYCKVAKSTGDGTWAWSGETTIQLPKVAIYFDPSGPCASYGTGSHTVTKPTNCSSGGSGNGGGSVTTRSTSSSTGTEWTEWQKIGINILVNIVYMGIPENIGEIWAAQYPQQEGM